MIEINNIIPQISHTLYIASIRTKKYNTYTISFSLKTAKLLGIQNHKADELTIYKNNGIPCIRYATIDDKKRYKLALDNSLIYFTFTLNHHFEDGLYQFEDIGNDIFEIVLIQKYS